MPMPSSDDPPASRPPSIQILPIQTLKPELYERAWESIPHPTLPLLATAHAKEVTVFSLSTLTSHSVATSGHERSVRTVAWKPSAAKDDMAFVTGSFDSTAAIWRWVGERLEREVKMSDVEPAGNEDGNGDSGDSSDEDKEDVDYEWVLSLVLEGHDTEIKSCVFSPSGAHMATCSRDGSIWIWVDIGAAAEDDEWETIATLQEHEGDVKTLAWCPDVPGRNLAGRGHAGSEVLASGGYDNTVRIWREDEVGDWVCVSVLEGHEGIVWGLQWEPVPKEDNLFPRLMTCSSDSTIRVWTRTPQHGAGGDEEDEDLDPDHGARDSLLDHLGKVPNTMRGSLIEEWTCTAVLPRLHDGQIYSISWSAKTGIVASTGSDGLVALYREDEGVGATWSVLAQYPVAHGAYEINHITWCLRYDGQARRRGEEEMLVTTGDDGLVKAWEVRLP